MTGFLLPIYYFVINWDVYLFYKINHFRNPFLDVLMPFITNFDNWLPLIIVILLWMLIRGGKKERFAIIGAILVIVIADQVASGILKPLFKRARPCVALPDIFYWKMKKSFSFASSHAANTAGMATYFGIKFRKSLPILAIFSILISWSRIYLDYHFPLDVFAGILIGIYAGVFVILVEKIIIEHVLP